LFKKLGLSFRRGGRKEIVVHSYPQMGQLPLLRELGGFSSRKDPPRRAGRRAAKKL